MEEINRYGVTESRSKGWGATFFILLALILLLLVVVFVMLWIATKSAEAAAVATAVTILVICVVGLILWSYNAGSKTASTTAQNIVASMATIVTARNAMPVGDIYEAEIVNNGGGRFLKSGNQMHRSDKVEAAAVKVWRELCPHTPPTRQNIMSVTQSSSAEFCSLVLNYLRDKELVKSGGQGQVSAWK